jgi:hypothetical protein
VKKRRINPNLAKIHRAYKIEELADLYSVHKTLSGIGFRMA